MNSIALFGSTGSIGTQALSVIDNHKNEFVVSSMTAGSNLNLFLQQIEKFKPRFVAMKNIVCNKQLQQILKKSSTIVLDNIEEVAKESSYSTMLLASTGISGLNSAIVAIDKGATLAIANKETLVFAGEWLIDYAENHNTSIIPVDSEHSAIFQCLLSGLKTQVKRLILTASGGAFKDYTTEMLKDVTPQQALKHPTWKMGKKVTIDSATLFNKGLEVLEAIYLFKIPVEKINIVIQPQSIIHSMVEYDDSSVIAQLSNPSMQIPIQLALTYPQRLETKIESLDFNKLSSITFMPVNYDKYPALRLALDCAKMQGNAPVVMNAADEIAVQLFLNNRIEFTKIPYYIENAINKFASPAPLSLSDKLLLDTEVRNYLLSI